MHDHKLKTKILSEYNDKLLFLTIDGETPQVVVSSEGLNAATIVKEKSKVLKEAAKYLSKDITQCSSTYKMPWPLIVENPNNQEQNLPKLFLCCCYKIRKTIH